jgi:hypothetical protein
MAMSKKVLGWRFVQLDGTTPHLADRDVVGKTRHVTGTIELCQNGLHGSIRPLDAVRYGCGALVQRVQHSGTVLHDTDKLCSSARKLLWEADATTALHLFACDEAERVLLTERDAGRDPDPRSWEAIRVKRAWICGEATDEELDEARAAAARVARAAYAAAAAEAPNTAAATYAARAARAAYAADAAAETADAADAAATANTAAYAAYAADASVAATDAADAAANVRLTTLLETLQPA